MEDSTGLGPAMVEISDIQADPVNFRDREGGEFQYAGKAPPHLRKIYMDIPKRKYTVPRGRNNLKQI